MTDQDQANLLTAAVQTETPSTEQPSLAPSVTLEQAQDIVATKTAPRVTKESIEKKIEKIEFLAKDSLTICLITMDNNFRVLGKAAPASPANYDQAVGQRYAYEDAFKQLWAFEGYLLCEQLYLSSLGAATPAAGSPEETIIEGLGATAPAPEPYQGDSGDESNHGC